MATKWGQTSYRHGDKAIQREFERKNAGATPVIQQPNAGETQDGSTGPVEGPGGALPGGGGQEGGFVTKAVQWALTVLHGMAVVGKKKVVQALNFISGPQPISYKADMLPVVFRLTPKGIASDLKTIDDAQQVDIEAWALGRPGHPAVTVENTDPNVALGLDGVNQKLTVTWTGPEIESLPDGPRNSVLHLEYSYDEDDNEIHTWEVSDWVTLDHNGKMWFYGGAIRIESIEETSYQCPLYIDNSGYNGSTPTIATKCLDPGTTGAVNIGLWLGATQQDLYEFTAIHAQGKIVLVENDSAGTNAIEVIRSYTYSIPNYGFQVSKTGKMTSYDLSGIGDRYIGADANGVIKPMPDPIGEHRFVRIFEGFTLLTDEMEEIFDSVLGDLIIPTGSYWTIHLTASAMTTTNGKVASWVILDAIKNDGGTLTFVRMPGFNNAPAIYSGDQTDLWEVELDKDDVTKKLKVMVLGSAAETTNFTVRLEIIEVKI